MIGIKIMAPTVQNVIVNKSAGIAEVSPAIYLEKRSSKALTVLQEHH
jgi:hypothetical protein